MNITDIYVFSIIKHLKKDNDLNNKIRENIIYNIIKNTIHDEWYREIKEWNELKTKLYEIIKSISSNIIYDNIDIELKGGRKFNYDFELHQPKRKNGTRLFIFIYLKTMF